MRDEEGGKIQRFMTSERRNKVIDEESNAERGER